MMSCLALLPACGEPEAEVDPRCERGWVCGADISTREGCVDGEYVTQDCAEGEWCLEIRQDDSSYQGACVPRSWRASGCDVDPSVCTDGWACLDGVCRETCSGGGDDYACLLEDHACRGVLGVRPLVCVTVEYYR